MTGYAEASGGDAHRRWRWEARSVNGRGLDLRLRLPEGWEALDPALRKAAAAGLRRGSVTIALRVEESPSDSPALDEAALAAALGAAQAAAAAARRAGLEVAPVAPERLIALRGVMTSGQAAPVDEAARAAALADAAAALEGLAAARAEEGAATAQALRGQFDEIERLVAAAREAHAAQAAAAPDRLRARVTALLGAGAEIAPDRLAAELALLAVRADVDEELSRLDAHIAAARRLLTRGGPVGRELEFQIQEFNREANTLCSKADSARLTEAGLAMKVAIDRMREQAANVE